jgi:hypothetical protein
MIKSSTKTGERRKLTLNLVVIQVVDLAWVAFEAIQALLSQVYHFTFLGSLVYGL